MSPGYWILDVIKYKGSLAINKLSRTNMIGGRDQGKIH
jgi:hypothetical protein